MLFTAHLRRQWSINIISKVSENQNGMRNCESEESVNVIFLKSEMCNLI